jgi:hypothetical protein
VNAVGGVLEAPCKEILQAYFNMKRGRETTDPA